LRIARQGGDDGGYWSYLGTDILHIAADQPTLNLEGFTMNTDESEFVRVVRHETGHTMGFPHEHLRHEIVERIDREKAIAYYRRMFGWEPDKTIRNVLTALDESALIATSHADPTSIMCYWLPAEIMKDGVAVPGGSDIDVADMEFAKSVYPVGRDRFAVRRGNQVIFQERMSDVGAMSSGMAMETPRTSTLSATGLVTARISWPCAEATRSSIRRTSLIQPALPLAMATATPRTSTSWAIGP
jgi:hypothetical protein